MARFRSDRQRKAVMAKLSASGSLIPARTITERRDVFFSREAAKKEANRILEDEGISAVVRRVPVEPLPGVIYKEMPTRWKVFMERG